MKPHYRQSNRLHPLTDRELQALRPLLHPSSPPLDGLELLDWAIRKMEDVLAETERLASPLKTG